jgi:hypothetical protein
MTDKPKVQFGLAGFFRKKVEKNVLKMPVKEQKAFATFPIHG